MEIETAPGRGARITLTVSAETLPPAADQPPEKKQGKEQAEKIRIRRKSDACSVLIVDDHKIMRDGLSRLFQFESDIEVVGEAADGMQAIEMAEKLNPDIIIMDVNLGKISGMEATKQILSKNPHIKIIGLSMHRDSGIDEAMRQAGAVAYLTKSAPSEDLLKTLRTVISGKTKNPSRESGQPNGKKN